MIISEKGHTLTDTEDNTDLVWRWTIKSAVAIFLVVDLPAYIKGRRLHMSVSTFIKGQLDLNPIM